MALRKLSLITDKRTLFAATTQISNVCLVGAFQRSWPTSRGASLLPTGRYFNAHTAPKGLLVIILASSNHDPSGLFVQR